MHIGKTAGSAVNQMLAAHFGERFTDHIERQTGWWERLDGYDCLSGHVQYRVFANATKGRTFRAFTIIREPISQFRSHLNWIKVLGTNENMRKMTPPAVLALSDDLLTIDMKDPEAVAAFIRRDPESLLRTSLFDNCQARYFLGVPFRDKFGTDDFRLALESMDRMDYVGVNDNLPAAVASISALLETDGLKLPYANVQKYDRDVDREAWRKAIGAWIGFDCALYELARMRA